MNIETAIKTLIDNRTKMDESFIQLFNEALSYCAENNLIAKQLTLYNIKASGHSSKRDNKSVEDCYKKIEEIRDTNTHDQRIQNIANYSLGVYHWNFCRYKTALALFEKTLKNESDKIKITSIKHKIALCYYKLTNYSKALSIFEDLYENIDSVSDDFTKQDILSWHSILYNELGNIEQSIKLAQQALEINLKISNYDGISSNNNTLGLAYKSMGYYEQAMKYFSEAEKNALVLDLAIHLANVYSNMALVYEKMDNLKTAIAFNEKSIMYRKQCMGLDQLIVTYRNIIPLYIKVDQIENAKYLLIEMKKLCNQINTDKAEIHYLLSESYIAYYDEDWNRATKSLDIALSIAKKQDSLTFISSIYSYYSLIYEKKNDLKNALKYLKLLNSIETKIRKHEDSKLTENLAIQHQVLMDKYNLNNRIKEEKIKAALALSVTANHEINQPLMLIQGNIELLKDTITHPTEKQEKLFDKIDNGISKINNILSKFTHKTNISFVEYIDNIEMVKFEE